MVFRTLGAGYLLGLSQPEQEPEPVGGSAPAAEAAGGDAQTNGPRHTRDLTID